MASRLGRAALAGGVLAAALAALVMPGAAEPLDADTCEKLKAEQAGLVQGGIPERMSRGAAWAKANLPAADLKAIERFITLEEQLNYRCGLAKTRTRLPVAEEDVPPPPPAPPGEGPAKEPATKDAAKAAAKPAPAKAPAADKAAATAKARPKAPAAEAAPPSKVGGPSDGSAPAKPAPKVKPKVDDAYRPPVPAPAPVPGSG